MKELKGQLASVPRLSLRSKEATRALSISERTLHRLTAANQIPHIRLGGMVLYPVRELRSWLTSQLETVDAGKPI
ncbi:MAG: helix-turn-helix domain-containing protein [Pirellulaceae bacterium]